MFKRIASLRVKPPPNRWRDMSLNDLMQTMGQTQDGSIDRAYAEAEFSRRQFVNSRRSTIVSIIAACFALVSAFAAWTAVLTARAESRIATSIDIGRKHLTDPQVAVGRQIAVKLIGGASTDVFKDTQASAAWNQFALDADFMGRLLERGRLDRDYLIPPVMCDIWLADLASRKLPSSKTTPQSDLVKSLASDCSAMFHP
jgi:hypothetical protein